MEIDQMAIDHNKMQNVKITKITIMTINDTITVTVITMDRGPFPIKTLLIQCTDRGLRTIMSTETMTRITEDTINMIPGIVMTTRNGVRSTFKTLIARSLTEKSRICLLPLVESRDAMYSVMFHLVPPITASSDLKESILQRMHSLNSMVSFSTEHRSESKWLGHCREIAKKEIFEKIMVEITIDIHSETGWTVVAEVINQGHHHRISIDIVVITRLQRR